MSDLTHACLCVLVDSHTSTESESQSESESESDSSNDELLFIGESFEVRCSGGEGVLHVHRFATGRCVCDLDLFLMISLVECYFLSRSTAAIARCSLVS